MTISTLEKGQIRNRPRNPSICVVSRRIFVLFVRQKKENIIQRDFGPTMARVRRLTIIYWLLSFK